MGLRAAMGTAHAGTAATSSAANTGRRMPRVVTARMPPSEAAIQPLAGESVDSRGELSKGMDPGSLMELRSTITEVSATH